MKKHIDHISKKEVMEKLGPAAQEAGMSAMKAARRVEVNEGWMRPDLSYASP